MYLNVYHLQGQCKEYGALQNEQITNLQKLLQ